MSLKAVVRFGSDGKSFVIPFESTDTVSQFIQKIADERGVNDISALIIQYRGKSYSWNQYKDTSVGSIGLSDKAQIAITTRCNGGI